MKAVARRFGMVLMSLVFMAEASAETPRILDLSSPPPSDEVRRTRPVPDLTKFVRIDGVPAYYWTYGCFNTSAGMVLGYYDRTNCPDLFDGEMPLDNADFPVVELSAKLKTATLPALASENHIKDYWTEYLAFADPAYRVRPFHRDDCLADYLGTNQAARYSNADGGTKMAIYSSGTKLENSSYAQDGMRGMARFIEARGYQVKKCYTQAVGENGFTFDDFKALIDSKVPVLVFLDGHVVTGTGYSTEGEKILVHDTWGFDPVELNWSGKTTFYGEIVGVGVVIPDPDKPAGIPTVLKYTADLNGKKYTGLLILEVFDGKRIGRVGEFKIMAKQRYYFSFESDPGQCRLDFDGINVFGEIYMPSTNSMVVVSGTCKDGVYSMQGTGSVYLSQERMGVARVQFRTDPKNDLSGLSFEDAMESIRNSLYEDRIFENK